MHRASLGIGVVAISLVAIGACVADEPDTTGGTTGDGDASNGDSGAGGDGTTSGDGSSAKDSGVDAGVRCGFAGEPCCVLPLQACGQGTTCRTNECMVNDAWMVGDYLAAYPDAGVIFAFFSGSAHFDGSAWAEGPTMGVSTKTRNATSVWVPIPGNATATTSQGEVLIYNGAPKPEWRFCSADAGANGLNGETCTTAPNNDALYTVTGFSPADFWIAGTNALAHCDKNPCTTTSSGMPGTWGQGVLTGSSSTDLWLTAPDDRPFHFDGGTWFRFPAEQARAIWAHSPTDVWAGDTAFQHFDGANWSPPFALLYGDGGAPGTVYAMSGGSTDSVWAVGGTDTTAFASHWDGTQWNTSPIPGATGRGVAVWGPAKDQAFVVAGGGPFAWNGTTWTPITVENPVSASMSWNAIAGSASPRP